MAARFQLRLLAALLALGLGSLLLDARAAEFVGPPKPADAAIEDPFPIRRILLSKTQMAAELERAKQGVLFRLSRSDFEDRVRRATAGQKSVSEKPRLVDARYRAKLIRNGLDENSLAGTAEWKIVQNGSGSGLLPLDSLQVAVRQARWTDNRQATIGFLDANPQAGPALLIEKPGEHSLALDWSSRGVPAPGELRFDLQLPPAPIALFDLELPADVVPIFPQDDVLASGPFPTDGADRHGWRVAFGGLSHLEISLRAAQTASLAVPIQTTLATRQDLSPGLAICQYAFDFKALRGDLSQLLVEHDPELTPTEVVVPNLDMWKSLSGTVNGRKRISIRLREPAKSGQLRISATAPLPFAESAVWNSPAMQIVGAIQRSENIRWRMAPELQIVEWKAGSFRFLRNEFAPNRSQILTMESSLLPEGKETPVRPSARFRPPATEFQTDQQIEWAIGTDHSTLTSHLSLEVLRGTLSQLALRLPSGWDVDQVDSPQRDLHPNWAILPGANPILNVEFQRSLIGGTEGQLVIRLRQAGPTGSRAVPQSLAFPDVLPLGSRQRRGRYTVRVSPALAASAPQPAEEPEPLGPRLPDSSDGTAVWTYRFHGQPPVGPLQISARTPRLSARTESEATLRDGRPTVLTRLILKPEAGALYSIVLASTEPVAEPWVWKTVRGANRVLSVQPLPIGEAAVLLGTFGAPTALGKAAQVQNRSSMRWWRMNFVRPLETPLMIESVYERAPPVLSPHFQRLRALALLASASPLAPIATSAVLTFPPFPASERMPVPLVRVVGASESSGTVSVDLPEVPGRIVEATGLLRDRTASSSAVYRFSDGPISLVLASKPATVGKAAPQIDGAEFFAVVDSIGAYRCLYRFRIRNGNEGILPVKLPGGAALREIAVAGLSLEPERCRFEKAGVRVLCSFPIPAGNDWHRVELLYDLPNEAWTLSTFLEPPIPELPIFVPAPRTIWRLAPGIIPLAEENLERLPGGPALKSRLHVPWIANLFDRSIPDRREYQGDPSSRASPLSKREDATPKTFRRWLVGPGSPSEKPILDLDGLAEAGIDDSTLLPVPEADRAIWDSVGLVAISTPEGTVLTTPRQQSLWRTENGLLPSIREALQEASRSGRDSSGRFCTPAEWLAGSPQRDNSLLVRLGGDGSGWTAWEMREGNNPRRLEVVHTAHIAIAGWLAAALLAAIGIFAVGRLGRTGPILLLFWLFGTGSALIWLPVSLSGLAVGPMLAGLSIAVISAYCRKSRIKENPTVLTRASTRQRFPLAASARMIAVILSMGLTARAAAPEIATVYLLPGTESDAEPKVVLAPPDLLERLDRLAQPRLALREAAFLRARYIGREEVAGTVEFEAQFEVVTFVERTTLAIPLGDVRLREILLDGAAAFPKTSGIERYTVEIDGKGDHRIQVKFSVPVAGGGTDREVHFGTPELPVCQLTFTAPPGAEQVQAINWRGAQQRSADGKELQVDLGRTRTVHLRWRQAGGSGQAQVRVQEAALWDIDPTTSTLFSTFDYRIAQGNLSTLKIALPPQVEVSRLELRPEIVLPGAPPAGVKDWSVGPNRVLTIELLSPLSGTVRLLLECIPHKMFSTHPALQFPSAVDVAESETFAAFRLRSLETPVDFERRGVAEFSAESFVRDIWKGAGFEKSPPPVTRAFRRVKNEPILLRPILQASPPANRGDQELVWWLGPHGATVRGTAHWVAIAEPITFVDWEVPAGTTIDEVRGSGLQSWLRVGNRVQAWLREPAGEVALYWYGSMHRGQPPAETRIFDLPSIRLDGVSSQATTLRLRVPEGYTLTPENSVKLGEPIPPLLPRELAWRNNRPGTSARLILRGPQRDGLFRSLTVAEVAERKLIATTQIVPSLRRDRPHSFVIAVDNADGWNIDLACPPGCRAIAKAEAADRREWIVDVPPREFDPLSFRVACSRPLTAKQELSLPVIAIRQGELPVPIERQFVLLGREVRGVETSGLRLAIELPEVALAAWRREWASLQERGGSVWKSASPRIQASPLPLDATPAVRLLLADYEAAPLGDRWVYRASVDWLQESGIPLDCVRPAGGRLEGFALDGVEQAMTNRDTLPILLPTEPGMHLLQIVWSSPDFSCRPLHFKMADSPLVAESTLWTAHSPLGERLEVDGPLSSAALDLRRAEVLLRPEEAGTVHPLRVATLEKLPCADAFRRGVPIHWTVERDHPQQEVRRVPRISSLALPNLVSFGLIALAVFVLGFLMLVLGHPLWPEQVAVIGVIGAAAFGFPEGIAFLTVTLFGFAIRMGWMGKRALRWAMGSVANNSGFNH